MKRKTPDDERPVRIIPETCDPLLIITKYIEKDFFTDLYGYLHWFATCSTTRTYYKFKNSKELAREVEKKMLFHKKYESVSLQYAVRHTQIQLYNFVDFMKLNAFLEIQLEGICLDMATMDEHHNINDPRKRAYPLCRLHNMGSILHPKKEDYFCVYFYQIFIWSSQWIKMRYGWDLVVSDSDDDDFDNSLMDLSNISDSEFNTKSCSYYEVFACCVKYHT